MTIDNLKSLAWGAEQFGLEHITVWTPQGWKAPKGFPRRELLCVPTQGGKLWRIKTAALQRFLRRFAP